MLNIETPMIMVQFEFHLLLQFIQTRNALNLLHYISSLQYYYCHSMTEKSCSEKALISIALSVKRFSSTPTATVYWQNVVFCVLLFIWFKRARLCTYMTMGKHVDKQCKSSWIDLEIYLFRYFLHAHAQLLESLIFIIYLHVFFNFDLMKFNERYHVFAVYVISQLGIFNYF